MLDAQDGKFPYAEVAGAVEKCGATHVETNVSQTHVDKDNKLVTTAAFMYEGKFHEIHDGVAKMVEDVFTLL